MTDTVNFMDLALDGKPVQFRNAFDDLMKDKVASVLDKAHTEVISTLRGVEISSDDEQELDSEEQLTPEEEAELDNDEDV